MARNCMLAEDAEEDKLRFPLGLQPKIDGVRGWYPEDKLLARSNKEFGNRHTQQHFSNPVYQYLDGEFAAERETHPDLCRITSSATRTFEGKPFLIWHAFDYLHPDVVNLTYEERYAALQQHVSELQGAGEVHVRLVPMVVVNNLEELLYWKEKWLNMGYEGVIIRDLKGKYKFGRSTVKQMGLLRIKDFIDFEFICTRIVEGETNLNEATVDERGYTKRSSHQENKVPNGMVGSLEGTVVKDVKDPQTKKILLTKGQQVTVSPGEMDHSMRVFYFQNPHEILNKVNKAKFFPKGHKEKPRFPNWQSIKSAEDM